LYFTNCVLVIYYLIIIVRFASHEEVNTFSVFFLENETDDPSVSQMYLIIVETSYNIASRDWGTVTQQQQLFAISVPSASSSFFPMLGHLMSRIFDSSTRKQ
jgi:hypothetical protein